MQESLELLAKLKAINQNPATNPNNAINFPYCWKTSQLFLQPLF
jgi:hypothetical protein